MKELKVKDIMTRSVITISEDALVYEAAEMLVDNDISGLAVTSVDGELVGVLSEADMIRLVSGDMEGNLGKITVKEIMTSPAITVNREDDLMEAVRFMGIYSIHRLIVQQEVKVGEKTKLFPAGILSISDVVKAMARK
ncbi:MAG: CBS domain-containing protein [bacterium]|nr:CBS domain-containing protein [bacterium]